MAPFLPMRSPGRSSIVYGAPAPERKEQHRVGRSEFATLLLASYFDDEGRRAGHWRSPSPLAKACFLWTRKPRILPIASIGP
jgi:hypothetical protein